jgi:F0F1-type ATP synthase membrane subunit c/vacuolar-type H+-ATPase subunit K
MPNKSRLFIGLIIGVIVGLFQATKVVAQDLTAGVAESLPIVGEIKDSMVLCGTTGGNSPCTTTFDANMVGVVALSPAAAFGPLTPISGSAPVVHSGRVYVLVNQLGGPIKAGDFITSSSEAGVAMKADRSGYALGTALQSWNGEGVGRILTEIKIRPVVFTYGTGSNLISAIKQGMEGAYSTPLSALRYLTAGIIAIISLWYGLSHFGHLAKTGVEAVGRNPLATKAIQMSLVLNVVMSLVVAGIGLLVAYIILVL